MKRRAWMIVAASAWCATAFAADPAPGVEDLFRKLAVALSDGKPAALWLLFDPSMPGYKQFRATSGALLQQAQAQAAISILKDEGDDRGRNLELDWRMEIVQTEGYTSTTERNATVKCRLENRDGNWRIVSFAPLNLFAPVHAGEAWDALVNAVATLKRPQDSPATTSWFFQSVDPAMPGIETLRAGLDGLLRRGDLESTLDLISNEGDDQVLKLDVDWDLQVDDPNTGIAAIHKERHIQVRMVWQGKRWRIAGIEPLDFFSL